MSLPIVNKQLTTCPQQPQNVAVVGLSAADVATCMAMSRSCDCLTQTDISAVLTPRNEQMPPAPPAAQYLQFKRVDISLETSDSEAAASASAMGRQPQIQSSEHQSRLLMQQHQSDDSTHPRSRSKSPRPQTLPGLVKASQNRNEEVTSPKAPQPVKVYAKSLVEGILTDTITKALSDADEKCNNDQETDVSLSLEPDPVNPACKSPSSHVETDSLDESEHAGQHS